MIYSNYAFNRDYILPVTSDSSFKLIHLKNGMKHHAEISGYISDMYRNYIEVAPGIFKAISN